MNEDIASVKSKRLSVARRSESYKFISDLIWVGLGQLFISLTALVVLPALTKNYPSEIYGLWAQISATIGFLMILTLKFESATIRFLAAEENAESRRLAIGAMLWPILVVSCIVLSLSFLFRQGLSTFLFAGSEFADYVPLVALWAIMEALFLFLNTYQRARGRIRTFAFIRLASSVVRMLVILSLASAAFSFYGIISSVIIIQSIFVAGVLILVTAELGFPKFNSAGLKEYLLYSIPLFPGLVLFWVINVSDRYFIAHIINISETGVYSASYSLAGLLLLLGWPIGMVLFPKVSKLWEQGDHEKVKIYFEYSMKLFLLLSLPASAGLYLLSQPLLGTLATSDYKAGGLLVLLLTIGITFYGVYVVNEYVIYLIKKTIWLPFIVGAGAVINAIMNIAMIPSMGIMAAAISTAVSFAVISIFLFFLARRYISYRLEYMFILKVIAATIIMSVALWYVDVNSILSVFVVIVAGIAVYGIAIYLLKVFSDEDKKVIGDIFTGFRSNFKSH